MKYLAQLGAALLAVALILTWRQYTWPALLTLIAAGGFDLYLEMDNKQTISQWIHSLWGKKVDVGIMIGILIYTWGVFGPEGFVPVLIGCIAGHLFWQEKQE